MKRIYKYLITIAITLVLTFLIALSQNIFELTEAKDIYKALTNSFFASGVFVGSYGLLIVASNGGMFDMLSYGIVRFFDMFRRDFSKIKHKTYYDYKMAKGDRKRPFGFILLVGIIFIIISLIFLYFYEKQ